MHAHAVQWTVGGETVGRDMPYKSGLISSETVRIVHIKLQAVTRDQFTAPKGYNKAVLYAWRLQS